MQTVILCAEKNEALEPAVNETPLELISICGKKIIDYAVDCLEKNEIQNAVVITQSPDTREYIEGLEVRDIDLEVYFDPDASKSMKNLVESVWNGIDELLLIQLDSVLKVNLADFIRFHDARNAFASVYAVLTDDISDATAVDFEDDGKLKSFIKNPASGYASTNYVCSGVYILSAGMLSSMLSKEEDQKGGRGFLNFKKGQAVYVYRDSKDSFYKKISDVKSLLKCGSLLIASDSIKVRGNLLQNNVYSNTPYLFRGVTFIPPVYIGKNVAIGMGSVISKGTVIEDEVIIGENCEISGSYIAPYAKVGSRTKLSGTVMCKNSQTLKGVECEEMSVLGAGSTIEENSVVSGGVKVWQNKTLEKNTRLKSNLRYGRKPGFCLDEEGQDRLVSASHAAELGCAAGSVVGLGEEIAVCYSGSAASQAYSLAAASGAASAGAQVWFLGRACEDEACFLTGMLGAQMYIMISESSVIKAHIKTAGGLLLKREAEHEMEKRIRGRFFRTAALDQCRKLIFAQELGARYVSYIESLLPEKFSKINVSVKTSSDITASYADSIINKRNDIDGDEIIFHMQSSNGKVTAYSEATGYVMYERLMLVILKDKLSRGEDAAVPFTFPSAAEQIARGYSGKLYRYFNSSGGVADAEARKVAALNSNLFAHDGLALICELVSLMNREKKTLYDLTQGLPEFYASERFISCEENMGPALSDIAQGGEKSSDGVVLNKDGSRAVIKPLKRGKGLMMYVDAASSETANAVCDEIEKKLKGISV